MLPSAQVRWRAVPNDALAWREWAGEIVVFNQQTGSTHLLGKLGGEVLRHLLAAEHGGPLRRSLRDCAITGAAPTPRVGLERSPRYYPILRGLAWRNRISLDRRRSVRPRTPTPAGRPRPAAAYRSRRLPHSIAPARHRPRTGAALSPIIQSRMPRKLCRFPRSRGPAPQFAPVAASAGAVFR